MKSGNAATDDGPDYAARQPAEEVAEDRKRYKDHERRPTQKLNPPDCGRTCLL